MADSEEKQVQPDRTEEAWERLSRVGQGAYPDTAAIRRAMRRIVNLVAVAIPVAVCLLLVVTGQGTETVFYLTFGAIVFSVMLVKTLP